MQQFGQALASGKLQGDELRSLLENMPTLVEKLAGQLGVSVATLRQMGTEGKLTSDVVLPAMLRIAGDVNEQFARMPMTVSRATDSLSQAWSNLVVQVDRATGGSQALANVIKAASDQVQRMADRWVPPSALEQLQTARAEFERIAEAQRRIDERGRGTIQPEMTAQRRGGINTGLQRAAAAQTPTATREELAVREEEIQQLERLARADADVAAALSALEVDTAAAAAAEAARQRVLEQLKEATESFGGANDKQRDQMQALRTVIAEGDGALAKYGITAQVAASMLAAFEARVDSVRGAIASLDAQITQNAANMLGGFTGRLNQALAQAAQRYGGDQSRINAQEFIEIFDRVRVVQEQAGAAALTAAENELALARARATGNRGAEARVRAEQNYRRNLADGYRDTDAAAIRTAELAAADAQAASASQARLQPLAQVRQALQLSTTAAQNAAAQSRLSATAQREAAERDKARAEALKVARSGTEAYNRAYAEFLRLIQDTNRAEAEADYNKRVSTLNDEIALIQREVELIGELPGVRNEEIAALRIRQELIASGRAYTQQEIDDVVRLTRAREQAREGLRQYQDVMSRIKSVSEEIARDAATMIYEQMMDRKKGEDVVDWFKALFKRIAIQALAAPSPRWSRNSTAPTWAWKAGSSTAISACAPATPASPPRPTASPRACLTSRAGSASTTVTWVMPSIWATRTASPVT
jgi:tape measure domain-containing protein